MFAATTSPSYSPTWVSGQIPLTSPDGPKPLARAQMLVNLDAAMGIGRYADGIQADPGHARAPTGCHEQPVAPQLRTVIETQDILRHSRE